MDNFFGLPPHAAEHDHNVAAAAVVVAADIATAAAVGALGAVSPLPAVAVSVSSVPLVLLSVGTTSGHGFPPAKTPSSACRCADPDKRNLSDSNTSDWLRTVPPGTVERPTVRDWNELPVRNCPAAGFRSDRCQLFLPVAALLAYTRSGWHHRRHSSAKTI